MDTKKINDIEVNDFVELIQSDENGKPLTYWGGLRELKQETLEEVAENHINNDLDLYESLVHGYISYDIGMDLLHKLFINGAKWQQERSYSEEDMKDYALKCISNYLFGNDFISDNLRIPIVENNNKQFEQFKNKK